MHYRTVLSTIVCLYFILFTTPLMYGEDKITDDDYIIFSVQKNRVVDLEEIVTSMKNYDVLFFGEEHNDPVAHYLEELLLKKLYARYPNLIALSLEMFERDVQLVLDEYLSGMITEKHFRKDARVWTNYKDYRPLIEFARMNDIPVIAANAPYRYSNIASTKGQQALESLSDAAKSFIAPLPYDTATGAYYQKLLSVKKNMPFSLPKKTPTDADTLKKMKMPVISMPEFKINQGQSLWDATMAHSLVRFSNKNTNKKIMHINGRFHSDEYFGVVQQLKKYAPDIKTLVVSTFSDSAFPEVDFNSYKNIADFIIITDPSVERTFE